MQIHDEIEGIIESLAFGGQGVLKTEGMVVFIPFTAPGDTVRCTVTAVKKNYAEAVLTQVITPGVSRTTPLCRHYGTCGGCQLQHIKYADQLEQKKQTVIDALKRIGKVELPSPPTISPATAMWGYRRHVTFTLSPAEKGYTFGYTAIDGKTLLATQECPIFSGADTAPFLELDTIFSSLASDASTRGRATILKIEGGKFMLHVRLKQLPRNTKEVFENAYHRWPFWGGLALETPTQTICVGPATTSLNIEGLAFMFNPKVFIQNNAEQSLNIYRDILSLADSENSRILDLYCGIGISSLLLAKNGATVFGVEGNPEAVAMATKNATANNIPTVSFLASDVRKGLKTWLKGFKPDLVLLNPPRTGLHKDVVQRIVENPPPKLVYVSCMPSTLARDVNLLCEGGYRIESCRLYDMFPQTTHIETMIELSLPAN